MTSAMDSALLTARRYADGGRTPANSSSLDSLMGAFRGIDYTPGIRESTNVEIAKPESSASFLAHHYLDAAKKIYDYATRPAYHKSQDELLDELSRSLPDTKPGYADGGETPSPDQMPFLERARRTANGAAGVLDHYLGGIPSSAIGLLPWNTMADTKAKAEDARDDWRKMYGRGALEAAENPFNPASGIILSLPMARRMPKRMLHPDDKGGANRMEAVANDLRSNMPTTADEAAGRLNKAWADHGVTIMPPTVEQPIRPFTSYEAPGSKGLINRDMDVQAGPLKSLYDDPALYAVNPIAARQDALVRISPSKPLAEQNGVYQPRSGRDPGHIEVNAANPELADNILKHEITHRNAAHSKFELPNGASPSHEPSYLDSGLTTDAINRIWRRIDELMSKDPRRLTAREIDEQAHLSDTVLPAARRMANYLDPERNPGEWLARMEQLFDMERRAGRNPYDRPIISYDDLDLRHLFGPDAGDLRVHRKYPLPQED